MQSFKLPLTLEQNRGLPFPEETIGYIFWSLILLLFAFSTPSLAFNRPQKKETPAINTPQPKLAYHK
jgi:hypothetical protein